jgi:RNA polymerase sigma-70 factor, ECF subfamily
MIANPGMELTSTLMAHGPAPIDGDPDLPLLQRIAAGDTRACGLLVDRHLQRLHALATRVLGNGADADEVCQDAFVRAWQQAPRWQPGAARFATWLHQVVMNLCRDRLRTRRESAPLEAIPEAAHEQTPEREQGRADTASLIRRGLAQLPQRQREALLLCHFQGLSNIEAAAAMALSVDALESLLARARRGLRDWLSGAGAGERGVES